MTTEPPRREAPASPIMRAMAGWQPAKVLMAANRLEVFNVLGEELLPVREIARRCGTHPRSTRLLLNACVALGFLRRQNNRYANTPEGLQLLVRGKPTYIGDGINHSDWLWRTWGRLADAVRSNKPVIAPAGPGEGPSIHRDFILAMHDRAMHTGEALAEALDLTGRRQLFDAGGGPGTYSCFLARRYPELRCIVFDLPPAIPIAEETIASFGLRDRVITRAGDYFRDDFGRGNDVVLLIGGGSQHASATGQAASAEGLRFPGLWRAGSGPREPHGLQQDLAHLRGALLAEHAGQHRRRALLQREGDHGLDEGDGLHEPHRQAPTSPRR